MTAKRLVPTQSPPKDFALHLVRNIESVAEEINADTVVVSWDDEYGHHDFTYYRAQK